MQLVGATSVLLVWLVAIAETWALACPNVFLLALFTDCHTQGEVTRLEDPVLDKIFASGDLRAFHGYFRVIIAELYQ